MHNPIDMVVFAKVVELKSFSAAADKLDMSSSVISKHITRLERSLGVRLLNRTTRRLSLTDAGYAVLDHCTAISKAAEAIELVASTFNTEPRGVLRLSAPGSFGSLHIAPALPDLLARYPQLTIEMVLSDKLVDLVEDRFDVAVTSDVIPGANLVVRKLAPIQWVVCATDAYLRRHGTPREVRDLQHHNCVFFSSNVTSGNEWRFLHGQTEHIVQVKGNFKVNNSQAVREAILGGLGIGLLPTFVVGAHMGPAQLRILLPEYKPVGLFDANFLAHYVAGKFVPPKVRVCVDFLVERFSEPVTWAI
jgi:DNA-binding transcriptional LysR family regulator